MTGGNKVGGIEQVLELAATQIGVSILALLLALLVALPVGLYFGHKGAGETSTSRLVRALDQAHAESPVEGEQAPTGLLGPRTPASGALRVRSPRGFQCGRGANRWQRLLR